jgi:predicted alpha/beta hydrolase family esterase
MLALVAAALLSSTCPAGRPLAGGHHSELITAQGRVHVWCRGERAPDAVVVYVHGYWDTLDSAFTGHRLAEQFAASGLDALFVVVEAPRGPRESVVVTDLDALVRELEGATGALPERTLLIGHSGGNRTLKRWLASPRAQEVVLLDGFYGSSKEWTQWLERQPGAKLSLVSRHTAPAAAQWVRGLSPALRARVSDAAAGCGHMEIVTTGAWLARVLLQFA